MQAVLWDMDGLLLDTERVALDSWKTAVEELGAEADEDVFRGIIGMNRKSWEAKLRQDLDGKIDVDALIEIANRVYSQRIEAGVPMKEGARDCLDLLYGKKIPQALATSTNRSYTKKKLGKHDLEDRFQAIVTGDQVEHGKPHPEIFQTAAQRLGISATQSIVFEDSPLGVQGASAAGAYVILVQDIAKHGEESLAKVDQQFTTLSDALPYLDTTFPDP